TDVIHEAETGDHTRVVQISHRYGMILFIASEVMFFVAWFWAFFDASLFTGESIQYARVEFTGGHWPPKGIEVFDPWHLPLLNTRGRARALPFMRRCPRLFACALAKAARVTTNIRRSRRLRPDCKDAVRAADEGMFPAVS